MTYWYFGGGGCCWPEPLIPGKICPHPVTGDGAAIGNSGALLCLWNAAPAQRHHMPTLGWGVMTIIGERFPSKLCYVNYTFSVVKAFQIQSYRVRA